MEFVPAKTIISAYAENDLWFGCNYNMNIYKGCCHGCIYCDSPAIASSDTDKILRGVKFETS